MHAHNSVISPQLTVKTRSSKEIRFLWRTKRLSLLHRFVSGKWLRIVSLGAILKVVEPKFERTQNIKKDRGAFVTIIANAIGGKILAVFSHLVCTSATTSSRTGKSKMTYSKVLGNLH